MTQVETNLKIEMPDGSFETYYRDVDDQLKIAIIGPPKGGKSRLASTAPKKPVYFFDYDGRLASVAGIAGVWGKSYLDTTNPVQSTAWNTLENDMAFFEYQKLRGNPIPGTVVFDSITYMSDRALRKIEVENKNNPKVTRITRVGTREYLSPGGWDTYSQEMSLIGNMLARGVELGCDVIAVFHERAEEAENSTPDEKKFTGKISVHPPRATVYLPLFNEYWRVLPSYDGKTYEVTVKPTYDFVGATCLDIDAKEPADIAQMVEKHKRNTLNKQNKG